MKNITTIDELIEFIRDHELTNEQIDKLCRITLGRSFLSVGDVDKFWFIDWLQNYKEKYHQLHESQKPFIINSDIPFDIRQIYKQKDA